MKLTFALCEAIVARLEEGSFALEYTPQARWSVPYEPYELAAMKVTVAPEISEDGDLLSRANAVTQRHRVSLLVQQKPPNVENESIEPLSVFQDAIYDHLRTSGPVTAGGLEFHWQPARANGFVRKHLQENRTYTGFIDLTYLCARG